MEMIRVDTGAFPLAFGRTLKHEGGFDNDPADPGGMTFMGVSREYHPGWPGWPIVDAELKRCGPPCLSLNSDLTLQVRLFYFTEFWQRLQCDFVATLSTEVAAELFDTGVNMGRTRAVEILQRALNLLNRNKKLYPDLVDDGLMGRNTRGTLAKYFELGMDERILLKLMNHLQGEYYINLMRRFPEKERFAGWFART